MEARARPILLRVALLAGLPLVVLACGGGGGGGEDGPGPVLPPQYGNEQDAQAGPGVADPGDHADAGVVGCEAAPEICDGADNDCDGAVDEVGCPCTADTTCFNGPPEARGLGECRDGTRTCDSLGEVFTDCVGSVGPTYELCDGLDNDCDGKVDDRACGDFPAGGGDGGGGTGGGNGGGNGGGSGEGGSGPPEGPCTPGDVQGVVCAPDGSAVAGARVSVDAWGCDGQRAHFEARTGADGMFVLEGLAPGAVTVTVRAGQFRQQRRVTVVAGQTVEAAGDGPNGCFEPDSASIAITTGEYDSVQAIVAQLGFHADIYCGGQDETYGARALFGDWDRLVRYDIVFINCGLGVRFDTAEGPQMLANLQRFVAQGGSLYVSDLAAHVIDQAFPAQLDFEATPVGAVDAETCCNCVDCRPICDAYPDATDGQCLGTSRGTCHNELMLRGAGAVGEVEGQVLDASLRQALGRDTLRIDYDIGEWIELRGVGADVTTLVESGGRPLMARFGVEGGGHVTYTTFHNRAQSAEDVVAILRALVFQL